MARNRGMELHDFYCLNCGKKGIGIFRNGGFQHGKFHRKKLYCPYCKLEVNHVECKSDEDVFLFKEAFENGEFREEAQMSINHIMNERN